MSELFLRNLATKELVTIKCDLAKVTVGEFKELAKKALQLDEAVELFGVAFCKDVVELNQAEEKTPLGKTGLAAGDVVILRPTSLRVTIKKKYKPTTSSESGSSSGSRVSSDMTEDRIWAVLETAKPADKKDLLEWLDKRAQKAIESKNFLKVPAKVLVEVLKRDSLRINEGKAFIPILAWLKAHCKNPDDKEEIKKVGAEIIPLIRFPTMSTTDIASKIVPLGILEQADVLELFTYLAIRDKSKPGTTLPALKKKWNTTKRRCGTELSYASMWDANGILYYIGTKKGTQVWQNPHTNGDVAVTTSQIGGMSGSVDYLVGRTPQSCWIPSSNIETNGSWFQLDLKKI